MSESPLSGHFARQKGLRDGRPVWTLRILAPEFGVIQSNLSSGAILAFRRLEGPSRHPAVSRGPVAHQFASPF
jgi:hypothetical protein